MERISKKYVYLPAIEPFSETEELLMNALIACESDGYKIGYEVRVNDDGEHEYRLKRRDAQIYEAHFPYDN